MKVLHIATTEGGGAGLGMLNQHFALLNKGIDSKILVAKKITNLETVYTASYKRNSIIRLIARVSRKMGLYFSAYDRSCERIRLLHKTNQVYFTAPLTEYDISSHPLVLESDIINIHWITGFLDIPSFFQKVNKPIIYTMRDENLGLGGFHYSHDKKEYYHIYKSLEEEFLELKAISIAKTSNFQIVSLSKIMLRFCKETSYLSSVPNTIIYNAINPEDYKMYEQKYAKRLLGINADTFVISFVSVDINEKRKGLENVIDAINQLTNCSIKLLCVGNGSLPIQNDRIQLLGPISDSKKISEIYSASDVFISASTQESFGKTIIEALYCGCPVISTAVGIAPEIISNKNGCLLDSNGVTDIKESIIKVIKNSYHRSEIREEIVSLFSPDAIAAQYITLYEKAITK